MSLSPSPLATAINNSSSSQPKKRTRVTPSQLTILEETFAISATPDSKMRKQLAQKLQMPERSIQIWFQNRRAKVKMLQKRALMREEQEAAKARLYAEAAAYVHQQQPYWYPRRSQAPKVPIQRAWSSDVVSAPPPPPPPPTFPPAFAAAPPPPPPPPFTATTPSLPLYIMPTESGLGYPDDDMRFRRIDSEPAPVIHDVSLTAEPGSGLITANTLTVGSWHRMKITHQDLLCYYNSTDRTFAWHIRDSDYHFKMVISFDIIASIEINSLPDNVSADIHVDLTEAPLFFMENGDNSWIQCSDFTEGMQATVILRHSIRGLTADLRHELFNIASLDETLCQITRFFNSSSISSSSSVMDQNYLWRHQSLPLGFGWAEESSF
ncbi:homeobox domain-containing protein [Fennellomyces sp. T-0311]|nr:homeobox domain-containing protein [Fennellomyces sp. T-0311]